MTLCARERGGPVLSAVNESELKLTQRVALHLMQSLDVRDSNDKTGKLI